MTKQQQNRGRANRRYQAAKKDFRKRPLKSPLWSRNERLWMDSLKTRDLTIDQEIEASLEAVIEDRPGLGTLPETYSVRERRLTREAQGEKAYQRALYQRSLS
jgi:hypothetical protein